MKNKNWFWGLFFIGAGALVIFNQLGYLAGFSLLSLLITILLVPVIIKSIFHANFWGILFPIALLAIAFAEPLGITNLTPWPVLLTALFGSIGFSTLFGNPWRKNCGNFCNTTNHENFDEVVNSPDKNNVEYRVNFGSAIKYVNSQELQTANFTCSFGALKVFFDNTKISPEGARINCDCSFGAIELYIPKTWRVINKINVSLAGVEEKNHRVESDGPDVILTGNINLSGVEIVYV